LRVAFERRATAPEAAARHSEASATPALWPGVSACEVAARRGPVGEAADEMLALGAALAVALGAALPVCVLEAVPVCVELAVSVWVEEPVPVSSEEPVQVWVPVCVDHGVPVCEDEGVPVCVELEIFVGLGLKKVLLRTLERHGREVTLAAERLLPAYRVTSLSPQQPTFPAAFIEQDAIEDVAIEIWPDRANAGTFTLPHQSSPQHVTDP